VRAAKKAVTAYANQAAADHYRRALEIAELLGGKVPPSGAQSCWRA
jgi:hypothetical protein